MRGAAKIKIGLARRLRRDSTQAEFRFWNRVRSRAIGGHKFVRQEPLGKYVVDFLCREKRLIVELDGGQHEESAKDRVRDQWLRDHNYRILRFWNNDVMTNMDGVLEKLADVLAEETPPHPVPASGGNRPLPASGER